MAMKTLTVAVWLGHGAINLVPKSLYNSLCSSEVLVSTYQEVEAPRISRQSAQEGSKVASPTYWPP
jgi:hypothetical protein